MMQATLLNFGDNTRVVNDMTNKAVSIPVGAIVECDIHDVHFHMIRRAIATETLMVVPKESKRTPKLAAIMELLSGLEVEPYDDLLRRFHEVLPPPGMEERSYRPTRDMIRVALRDASRLEVAKTIGLQSKVTIHEQGDEVTRREVPREIPGDPKTIVVPPSESQTPVVKESNDKRPAPKKAKGKGKSKPKKAVSKTRVRERL